MVPPFPCCRHRRSGQPALANRQWRSPAPAGVTHRSSDLTTFGARGQRPPRNARRVTDRDSSHQDDGVVLLVHGHRRSLGVAPLEQSQGQGVLHLALDDTAQWPGPEVGVEAGMGQPRLGGRGHRQAEAPLGEPPAQSQELDGDDPVEVRLGQRVEPHDLVDPVDELGLEVLDRLAGDVRRHDQHGVGEVDRAALAVGEAAVLQHLEQRVEDVGVGLLQLVEEHHRIGTPADGLGELAALFVPDIAGGRTDQAGHRVALAVLAHVDADYGPRVVEEELGQCTGQLGLADPGGPREEERSDRAVGIGQAGPAAADGVGHGRDRLVLAHHPGVERVLHPDELLHLALQQPADRHAGRPAHHLGHVLGVDLLLQEALGLLQFVERQIEEATEALNELQKTQRFLKEEVDAEDVAEVVSRATGVPVSRLLEGEVEKLIRMEDALHARVVGQDEAVSAVSNAIRRSRAGLSDPDRPIGSFLFTGPTGVGKTELARALAEFLFDDARAMVRIDMSEYGERHSVARLVGAPPGYVGYEEGGQLTEAIRRRPYAVVLLDELEKAHPDVFNTLLQVLEDGRLTDGQGRTVDFTNTVLIMTSNIPGEPIEYFKPEFVNRIDEIVRFQSLTEADLNRIVSIQLLRLRGRLTERRLGLSVTPAAESWLAHAGFDPDFGARPLRRVIQRQVEDALALALLEGRYPEGSTVTVDEKDDAIVLV